jgi:hypothetical protein
MFRGVSIVNTAEWLLTQALRGSRRRFRRPFLDITFQGPIEFTKSQTCVLEIRQTDGRSEGARGILLLRSDAGP